MYATEYQWLDCSRRLRPLDGRGVGFLYLLGAVMALRLFLAFWLAVAVVVVMELVL